MHGSDDLASLGKLLTACTSSEHIQHMMLHFSFLSVDDPDDLKNPWVYGEARSLEPSINKLLTSYPWPALNFFRLDWTPLSFEALKTCLATVPKRMPIILCCFYMTDISAELLDTVRGKATACSGIHGPDVSRLDEPMASTVEDVFWNPIHDWKYERDEDDWMEEQRAYQELKKADPSTEPDPAAYKLSRDRPSQASLTSTSGVKLQRIPSFGRSIIRLSKNRICLKLWNEGSSCQACLSPSYYGRFWEDLNYIILCRHSYLR
jgi:hypothetical protein